MADVTCETCGDTQLIQKSPCEKCGSIRVRGSDLKGMYVCATCGPYHGDLDSDDVIPCPDCQREPCERHMEEDGLGLTRRGHRQ